MPAEFTQGFFVRVPAWHKLGTVLDEYPGREAAMRLAGHDFDVVSAPLFARLGDEWNPIYVEIPGWKQLLAKSNGEERAAVHGQRLNICRDTYAEIQNSTPYDFAEVLLDQGFQYETGITLKDGALCALTLKLNEPIQITGDDSPVLPYLGLSWSHDGSGSLRGRSTTVRQVCANTVAASEAEGRRLGTDFSIRHTKNWRDRVEDAKKAIQGVRSDVEAYRAVMEEFAAMPVTASDRQLFAQALVLDQSVASVHRYEVNVAKGQHSHRVQTNVENATLAVLNLLNGPTIPEAHRDTAYGLFQAGVEYLDHVRSARSDDSRVGRSLLRDEPAKARLPKLVREIAAAA